MSSERRTGWIYHESYMWHDAGRAFAFNPTMQSAMQAWEHYENPETKRRLNNLLERSDFSEQLVQIKPRTANFEQVVRFHTPEYVEMVREMSAGNGGDAGESATFAHGGFEIAMLAVGGAITAVDAVLNNEVDNAYALVRPPGHHAERSRGRGFCIFGNVAIAAIYALADRGLARIATIDWDVHHGNGTQSAFYDRSDVLTISIHQDQWFPRDSGFMSEIGEGAGDGYNINIPLPPGSGHGAYLAAIEQVVVPALRVYRPDLIMVPSGFDGSMYDPLGRMMAYSETFRGMTRLLLEAADELCGGRLVLSHEGGYSPVYVPFCGLAVVEELSGRQSNVGDPQQEMAATVGGQELQPHQQARISEAAAMVARLRSLEGLT